MVNKEKTKKVKKWSTEEVAKIVEYILKHPNLEQPTARIYYKAFLEETPIQATWDLIRWKVRYLRTTYAKAEVWLQTATNALQNDSQADSSVIAEKLNRMCPHYNKLKQIFGVKQEINIEHSDSESSMSSSASRTALPSLKTEDDDDDGEGECKKEGNRSEAAATPYAEFHNERDTKKRQTLPVLPTASRCKRTPLLSTIKALARRQEERCETQRLRILFEQEKFRHELEFNKEKFKIEQAFRAQEFELKRLELEKNERLQIMEIEKNERIAKYEIDLKYRNYHINQK